MAHDQAAERAGVGARLGTGRALVAQQRVAQTLALLSPKDTMVHIFKALRSPNVLRRATGAVQFLWRIRALRYKASCNTNNGSSLRDFEILETFFLS